MSTFKLLALTAAVLTLAGCAVKQPTSYDYSAFKESRPRSIVVLPPLNQTPELRASHSMQRPLMPPSR